MRDEKRVTASMHSISTSISVEKLRNSTMFHTLEYDRVKGFVKHGSAVNYQRAELVLSCGDCLDGLYVVLDGKLKLFLLSCAGHERILRVLKAGDSFGEVIMFNMTPSTFFVETLCEVSLAYFPREVIADALHSDPMFATAMLHSMGAFMSELIGDLEACCLQTARQRTANYLLRQIEQSTPPNIEVNLPASKAIVASTLNLSAETFSRELHRLENQALIEINRRTIYVRDLNGLVASTESGV